MPRASLTRQRRNSGVRIFLVGRLWPALPVDVTAPPDARPQVTRRSRFSGIIRPAVNRSSPSVIVDRRLFHPSLQAIAAPQPSILLPLPSSPAMRFEHCAARASVKSQTRASTCPMSCRSGSANPTRSHPHSFATLPATRWRGAPRSIRTTSASRRCAVHWPTTWAAFMERHLSSTWPSRARA